MTRVQQLVEQVNSLTGEEREEFWVLLDGIDEHFELSDAWAEEVRRRIADLDSGRTEPVAWETVRDELRERIRAASG